MISVNMTCSSNHYFSWHSQPLINKTAAGNVLLAGAILVSGESFTLVKSMCDAFGLVIFGASTYYDVQNKWLFPAVNKHWQDERDSVLRTLQSQPQPLTILGDGQCDSPGFSAKYGVYSVAEQSSMKIIDFELVQVGEHEVKYSQHLEPTGFKRIVTRLLEHGLNIGTIATDRHTTIRAIIRKDFPGLQHQFDVWHMVKGVQKKLLLGGKKKSCKMILPWVKSVSNHLWWCAAECKGDADLLREMWVSIVNHIVNKHAWNYGSCFHKCAHAALHETDTTKYLKAGSQAHKLLTSVVMEKRLLRDVGHLTQFCHTGPLEVYHSLHLKYAPKRHHYSYKGMLARSQLTALDHNENANRLQAVDADGKKLYRPEYPKSQKDWILKKRYEKKTFGFRHDILCTALELRQGGKYFLTKTI
ncbi:PREDICTED: uncharacterized protein LOC106810658 [Priapulus caudatus]|uniref:Uncharacterized protein LOC106810658 n=1 Tax=Priapulus caudatus TaxID=37621 RepID=A0ABM1EBK8_PRICU|nr:PREDICTED: uncharacterized protein LOC106810658 [Priapulus caudatus]